MPNTPMALIFDMDDTLIATSERWREAENALLKKIGHTWSPELAIQYKGMNVLDVATTIHRLLEPKLSVESCREIIRNALFQAFEKHPLEPMSGAAACIRAFAGKMPIAVASGSPLPLIELGMKQLGIRECISVLASSESVARGKPFPDIFLAAASTMGASPRRCLVFEDSLIGVRAAGAAGMACFAVPSSSPQEITQIATRTFASLADITFDDVRAVFKPISGKA